MLGESHAVDEFGRRLAMRDRRRVAHFGVGAQFFNIFNHPYFGRFLEKELWSQLVRSKECLERALLRLIRPHETSREIAHRIGDTFLSASGDQLWERQKLGNMNCVQAAKHHRSDPGGLDGFLPWARWGWPWCKESVLRQYF
jgi:hypothetical protein